MFVVVHRATGEEFTAWDDDVPGMWWIDDPSDPGYGPKSAYRKVS